MAIDITTGVFNSSWKYLAFHEAGAAAGVQQLISKDSTNGAQKFIVEQAILSCVSGHIYVFDGSDNGVPIFTINADTSQTSNSTKWDFGNDPMEFTRDGTDICISAAGSIHGFIKWGWGS